MEVDGVIRRTLLNERVRLLKPSLNVFVHFGRGRQRDLVRYLRRKEIFTNSLKPFRFIRPGQ